MQTLQDEGTNYLRIYHSHIYIEILLFTNLEIFVTKKTQKTY